VTNKAVNPEDFAYYFMNRNELVLVSTTADVLGGRAELVAQNINITSLGCGIFIGATGIENCVAVTSGESETGGNDVTLTMDRWTCPTPGSPASCNESIANGTVTGKLSITRDQMSAGKCNGSVVCGPTQSIAATYSINSSTGTGYICLAASCPADAIDSNAITYSYGHLLVNDHTAAIGDLYTQFFETSTNGTVPFPCGGQAFTAGTVVAANSSVPNITGPLMLSPDKGCQGNDPFTGTIGGNTIASGSTNGQAPPAPYQDPAIQISGNFSFDAGEFTPSGTLTGRGTGTMAPNSPEPAGSLFEPANFLFYEANSNNVFLMQTDNSQINGGQALLQLRLSGCSDCFAVFVTPFNLSVPVGGSTQTTVAVLSAGSNTDVSKVQLNVSGLPNGVTGSFAPVTIDTSTGNAISTLTLRAAPGTVVTPNQQFNVTGTIDTVSNSALLASIGVVP